MTTSIAFDNSYARLPGPFFARVAPSTAPAPRLIRLNRALARRLGLDPDWLGSPDGVEILAGKRVPDGADPIATAYAGHQFGNFVHQLGDGRAILLGEVIDRDGRRQDIQLKGSGQTPFSRRGDGRAALGPVLREYLVSEAMAALGIPTTRALAAVLTGERVVREVLLPGAVLTRVASSHIRVGTFQFFAARGDLASLKTLADHAIARHDPDCAAAAQPYRTFLEGVTARQAELVAKWMHVGFIHGVMNTDNTSISGETIDYGPCAFMDAYNPDQVFSAIDEHGRYAYANQPRIMQWNLARLAECMLPLLHDDKEEALGQARAALDGFPVTYRTAQLAGWRRKIGLAEARDDDAALVQDLLDRMAANQADFTQTFRRLCDAALGPEHDSVVAGLFADPSAFDPWVARWRLRLADEALTPHDRSTAMRKVNPAIIPRNHRIEEAIRAAVDDNDFKPFAKLNDALAAPFDERPPDCPYTAPPQLDERVYRTFCGT